MAFAATWIGHRGYTKGSKSERDKYHMISHTWHLKYDIHEFIHEMETDSQTEQTSVCQGGGEVVKGWSGSLELTDGN